MTTFPSFGGAMQFSELRLPLIVIQRTVGAPLWLAAWCILASEYKIGVELGVTRDPALALRVGLGASESSIMTIMRALKEQELVAVGQGGAVSIPYMDLMLSSAQAAASLRAEAEATTQAHQHDLFDP